MKVLFVYTNCMMDNLIPVGASSVMGAIRQSCPWAEIRLFDTTFYRTETASSDRERSDLLQVIPVDYESRGLSIKKEDVFQDFRKTVEDFNPDIILLSAVEVTFRQGMALLEAIEDIKPFVVAGGVFSILAPEDVIKEKLVDAVCTAEGEDSVPEFLTKFKEGKNFYDIPGMWFRKDGEIIKNPVNRLVDLDKAAFMDFSLYEEKRFLKPMQGRIFKMIPLEFSRGCPYRCAYCANHAVEQKFKDAGRWYRWKTMDRIFAEIREYTRKYDVEFFYFVSETFLSMSPRKFDEFCERYANYKIPFWFNTRPETINERILRKLEDINCFRMGIGLEHGNEDFRRKMLNRSVSNETIVKACRMVENSKISYSINNMIGFPGETRELVFDTIGLNRRIKPDTVGTFVFTPFRGTDLYKYCLEHGHINHGTEAGDLNRESVLVNNTLGKEEIEGLLRTFPLYVGFDEKDFPLIEKAERFTDEGNRVFRELSGKYRQVHFGVKKGTSVDLTGRHECRPDRSTEDEIANAWSSESAIRFYKTKRGKMEDLYGSERYFLDGMLKKGKSVLDVGCAAGGFFNVLKEYKRPLDYTGVDISPKMIEEARRAHPNAKFRLIDGKKLPFSDGEFDLTVSFGVLHMTLDWKALLAEMWRVTKKACLFDLRVVREDGVTDFESSYQKIEFGKEWDGRSKAPYVVVALDEAMDFIKSLAPPVESVSAYGYWHPVSESTVSRFREVCMSVFYLGKKDFAGTDWRLPLKLKGTM